MPACGGDPRYLQWRYCSWECQVKARQPLRCMDEKAFALCAMQVGEEASVPEELKNTQSCAQHGALGSVNL